MYKASAQKKNEYFGQLHCHVNGEMVPEKDHLKSKEPHDTPMSIDNFSNSHVDEGLQTSPSFVDNEESFDFVKRTALLNSALRKDAFLILQGVISNYNMTKELNLGDLNLISNSFAVIGKEL